MKTMAKIYTALVFVFLYAPIAVLVLFSFNATRLFTYVCSTVFVFKFYFTRKFVSLFNCFG